LNELIYNTIFLRYELIHIRKKKQSIHKRIIKHIHEITLPAQITLQLYTTYIRPYLF